MSKRFKRFTSSFDASVKCDKKEATISYRIVSPNSKVIKSFAKKANFNSDIQSLELEALINLLREIENLGLKNVFITGDNKKIINEIKTNPTNKRTKLARQLIDERSLFLKWVSRKKNKEADKLTKECYVKGTINTNKRITAAIGSYCTLIQKCSICKEKKFYQEFPTKKKNPEKRDSRCFCCLSIYSIIAS
jgi:ribonuclease HI